LAKKKSFEGSATQVTKATFLRTKEVKMLRQTNLIFFSVFQSSDGEQSPAPIRGYDLGLATLALPPPQLVASDDPILRLRRRWFPTDNQGLRRGGLQGHVLRRICRNVGIGSGKQNKTFNIHGKITV